jgi:hypothetical protein
MTAAAAAAAAASSLGSTSADGGGHSAGCQLPPGIVFELLTRLLQLLPLLTGGDVKAVVLQTLLRLVDTGMRDAD